MKCSTMKRLAGGFVAVLAIASVSAANEMANPTGNSYYGFAGGSFGYGGVDAAGGMQASAAPGYAVPGYAVPGYAAAAAPGAGVAPQFTTYAGSGGFPYGYSGYGPNYGLAGYAYPYGYGYYGYGSASSGYGNGGRGCGRRHHCSFGSNCPCCNNVWAGYCNGDCGNGGGCCAGPVKVHRRHRPLGCGAGPCVDASCGASGAGYYGRPHRCHRRWQQGSPCGPTGAYGGYAPAGMTVESAPAQNAQPSPMNREPLQTPAPGIESDAPPTPEPSDNSST